MVHLNVWVLLKVVSGFPTFVLFLFSMFETSNLSNATGANLIVDNCVQIAAPSNYSVSSGRLNEESLLAANRATSDSQHMIGRLVTVTESEPSSPAISVITISSADSACFEDVHGKR